MNCFDVRVRTPQVFVSHNFANSPSAMDSSLRGSHRVYRHATARTIMTFQEVNGMAKPYQVRQLLDVIDDLTNQGE